MNPSNTPPFFGDTFGWLMQGSTEQTMTYGPCQENSGTIVYPVEPLTLNNNNLTATDLSYDFLFHSLHQREVQPSTVSNALNRASDLPDVFKPYTEYVLSILDNAEDINEATATTSKQSHAKRIHTCEKKHQCDKSKISFARQYSLKKHWRIHIEEKPYQCDKCQKSFADKSNLKRHSRIHMGEKPYQCEECQKCFTQLTHLESHKRIHSGEKPYQCQECQKSFTQQTHLVLHKRIHSGEKPYQCEECQISFSRTDSLKRHQRIHTGEKPYQCDKCQKWFRHQCTLKTHKRIHTGEKPYQCVECQKCFTRRRSQKTHKCTHNGEITSSVRLMPEALYRTEVKACIASASRMDK